MRRVVVGGFVSLDGVMQAPGGPEEDPTGGFEHGGWVFPFWDEATGDAIGETFEKPFDLLLGRRTYEIFAGFWPFQEGEIADPFNAATKYVATSSDKPLSWANSVRLEGDAVEAVARLRQEDGPDLVTQGSSVLVHSLLAAGLVDEMFLFTFPVLLGHGKKLIGDGSKPGEWELFDSKISATGVLLARYRPKGPVRTGSFADSEPSQAESARRDKMKREDDW